MKKKFKAGRFSMFIFGFLFLYPAALYANNAMDEEDCPLVSPDFNDTILLTREERIKLMEQRLKEAVSRVQNCRQSLSDANKKNNNSAGAGNAGADSSADGTAADAGGGADSSADGTAADAGNGADSSADGTAADAGGGADNAENNANHPSDSNAQNSAKAEQSNAQSPQTAVPDNELSGTEMPSGANEQSRPQESADATPEAEQSNAQSPQTAVPDNELSGTEMPSGANEQSRPQESSAMPSGKLAGTETPEPENAGAPSDLTEGRPPVTESDERALGSGKLPEDIPPANNDDIVARQIREAALAEPDSQKQARLWNEYRRYKGMPAK